MVSTVLVKKSSKYQKGDITQDIDIWHGVAA